MVIWKRTNENSYLFSQLFPDVINCSFSRIARRRVAVKTKCFHTWANSFYSFDKRLPLLVSVYQPGVLRYVPWPGRVTTSWDCSSVGNTGNYKLHIFKICAGYKDWQSWHRYTKSSVNSLAIMVLTFVTW